MTAQRSDDLTSDHPGLALGTWRLYGLVRGEPDASPTGCGTGVRVASFLPRPAAATSSANWKGFHEHYRLDRDGAVVLLTIRYDDEAERSTYRVDETLAGDFFLVLKAAFVAPRLYVRFRDGTLVEDRASWLHEQYVGPSPIATTLRSGCHPDFPGPPKLWYELFPLRR